ncbi:RNA helicase [Ectobacillus antri]|jgi:hypothetical protein|uniref:RNA helicase n=1 Tax=Ectobacillus antri TaxID=2486280 RepID=A0ABT6GZF4_9BACI|nr:RNA helicase [Ectobacillus antri]MDG4655724.1 RNA helicase [Ectobacillus antri]MDG5752399.1 RNA helicase [Ectobacillus antri]
MELTYYIAENERYQAFYTYLEGNIDPNEIYARQLCEYLVLNGEQYRLLSNEMELDKDMLIVEKLGPVASFPDEHSYTNKGVHIEFREYVTENHMPLLYTLELHPYGRTHWEALRYLLKDYVFIPTIGLRKRDSAEIDEDRGCYVIYVTTDTY